LAAGRGFVIVAFVTTVHSIGGLARAGNGQTAGRSLQKEHTRARAVDASPSAPSYNLPAQPTALIDREPQLRELVDLVRGASVRLLTLTGAAGCGKTRLALEVAEQVRKSFDHGTFLIDLAPIRHVDLVATAIAGPLGVRTWGAGRSSTTCASISENGTCCSSSTTVSRLCRPRQ
jgi:hypothetical protein